MQNNWTKNLRPASWRGVAFEVSGEDSEFGRNIVVHEFPQRDKPYVEDMGKRSRPYKMEAWLCAGPSNNFNVWTQRDALIAAVNKVGEGVLVHPFYGVLVGFIAVFTVHQSSTENGGLINFSIEFVESGERDFKASTEIDTGGLVASSIAASLEALKAEFANAFRLSAVGALIDQAGALVNGFVGVASTARTYASVASQIAYGNLTGLFGVAGLLGLNELTSFAGSTANALSIAESVVAIVGDLFEPQKLMTITLAGSIASEATTGGSSGSSAFIVAPIPAIDTPARNQQRLNQAAFVNLVQCTALIRSVEIAADLSATSPRYAADSTLVTSTPALITREEMEVTRSTVVNNVNAQIIQISAQGAFGATQAALGEIKAAIVRHLTVNGEQLARTFTTACGEGTSWNNFMPALPLAYRHYGQLTDDVIIDRNKIKNPLFINPRAPVVLLNDL